MKDYRKLDPGMGEGVANRTILRTDANGHKETWGEVAERVAYGNVSLTPVREGIYTGGEYAEYQNLKGHIAQGRVLLSGRHLQHGDALQSDRPGEVFTNCSTAATSAIKKYLLLNGSGVGRSYDDILMVVDWSKQPFVIPTLGIVPEDANAKYLTPGTLHPDAVGNSFESKEHALASYPNAIVFDVPDSREGWAKAVEQVERMAYEERRDDVLILDFSRVRPKGSPIGGMQGRPSSGPVPLMNALCGINLFRWKEMDMWEQAMRVDHALAEVVMVGGARRAARIAIKHWKDPGIFKFINIKQQGGLWTANNSVAVDTEFWHHVEQGMYYLRYDDEASFLEYEHAYNVFMACVKAQYEHGSGEPGFVNADKLVQNDKGMEVYADGIFAGNSRFQLDAASAEMGKEIVRRLNNMPYKMGINPCGEIALLATGGYCIIGDVAPFFCDSLDQVMDAVRACARALIRTNQMEFLYGKETKRTNRIGVSLTGIHEFAWKFFGLTFRELLDEYNPASVEFWKFLSILATECEHEADRYSDELGVERPHTVVTIKPAGTTSKLFALTEGAHLPAMREYVRWVQFREDDPLVEECEAKGYPVKWNLTDSKGAPVYEGMAIVGYPTEPLICRLGIPQDKLVIAPEATMEEQFHYLMLLEKHWLGTARPNQISYTLKYDKDVVSFNDYVTTILRYQPLVRCVTVMPASDWRVSKALFGYVPEEPIEHDEFLKLKDQIIETVIEDVDMNTLQCQSGACPI
jgi:adenosylcobalamin-dependent ribonucleoside-triphosphate reductase